MTIEAEFIRGLAQLSIVGCAMNVVAVETSDTATVHHTLYEIIPLHPVFVGRAVREIKKSLRFSKSVIFQLPIICELESYSIANGPIVIFTFDSV